MDVPENEGFDALKVWALLQRLKEERGIDFTVIDASQSPVSELSRAYEAAVKCSVWERYRIRKVFGTNKSSASFFGHGVPALLVYEGERPVQVFPHVGTDGEPATIREYLEMSLRGDDGGRQGLASRMDELRREIGPLGVSTSELVREGRRQ